MTNQDQSKRIKQIRKSLGGLTQTTFGGKIGVSKATMASIETGRSKVTSLQLEAMYEVYRINPLFVLTGEGEMFRSSGNQLIEPDPLQVEDPFKPYDIKGTPLVTIKAQAGYSDGNQLRNDLPVVRIPGLQDDNARVFEVAGESMDPVLNHGDFIACRKVNDSFDLRDGLLYVVVAREHGVSVKYVRRTVNAIRCTPHNTASFSPYNVPLDEVIELWEVQVRITRNILNNLVETMPVRLQARFERLEKVLEHLLSGQEDPK